MQAVLGFCGFLFVVFAMGSVIEHENIQEALRQGRTPETFTDVAKRSRRESVQTMDRTRKAGEKRRQRRRNAQAKNQKRGIPVISGIPAKLFNTRHLRSQRANGVSDEHRDMLVRVGRFKMVPPKLLYAIWKNESGLLPGGWSEKMTWYRPRALVSRSKHLKRVGLQTEEVYDSRCRRYRVDNDKDPAQCDVWYQSLRHICAQKRPDGTAVCDLDEIRVSFTFDMGPYQFNSSRITSKRNGRYHWNRDIDDTNGDGVFDPHDLQESMVAAASFLRSEYDTCRDRARHDGHELSIGCWGWAVNEYAGSQSRRYYQKRIRGLAAEWCSVPGYCD